MTATHQQGTGDDLLIVAEFPPGAKLGFSIEKNAVTEVKAAEPIVYSHHTYSFDLMRLN